MTDARNDEIPVKAAPDETSVAEGAPEVDGAAPGKALSPAARRALEEAAARRKAATAARPEKEIGGPAGEEPTRYGDWERGGRAVDF